MGQIPRITERISSFGIKRFDKVSAGFWPHIVYRFSFRCYAAATANAK